MVAPDELDRLEAVEILERPDELRTLRHEAGLSQQQLADLLGVSQFSISAWETGHRRISFARAHEAAVLLLDAAAARQNEISDG